MCHACPVSKRVRGVEDRRHRAQHSCDLILVRRWTFQNRMLLPKELEQFRYRGVLPVSDSRAVAQLAKIAVQRCMRPIYRADRPCVPKQKLRVLQSALHCAAGDDRLRSLDYTEMALQL